MTAFFAPETVPTRKHLFDLAPSVLTLNGYQSVKFNYEHFVAENSPNQLKIYYYTLNESKIDVDQWMKQRMDCAMSFLPAGNQLPIVLPIDDTVIKKFGSKFEHCSTLFDHAKHNSSDYLNGHRFVCLLLSVPIQKGTAKRYLHIPIRYRMWTKEESKLEWQRHSCALRWRVLGKSDLSSFSVTAGIPKERC